MRSSMKYCPLFAMLGILLSLSVRLSAQNSLTCRYDPEGNLSSIVTSGNLELPLKRPLPFLSFEVAKGSPTAAFQLLTVRNRPDFDAGMGIHTTIEEQKENDLTFHALVTMRNLSTDTLWVKNVVPFGFSTDRCCITGKGDHPLSRSYIFRPGCEPVNCILPDNSWEAGWTAVPVTDQVSITALTRRLREKSDKLIRRRFETGLAPGAALHYHFYAETFTGSWQDGLSRVFQQRMLYDPPTGNFQDSLYRRKDLQWIRKAYVAHLLMAWDDRVIDRTTGQYRLDAFLAKGKKMYGGDDFIGIWPTWPTLGLDQRNQWDLFRDLPGGLPALRKLSAQLSREGSHLFICYNPWDESTRTEQPMKGMASLIEATSSDGVVLDTRGAASRELQQAADSVRRGVILYSEGMAVPRDMEGIVSGRVHNALYHCPELNLNKLIRPDFAIFRVAEIFKERISREFYLSFFNGYGTELNLFAPGNPEWADDQYRLLGRIARLQRELSSTFTSGGEKILFPTFRDGIWVNEWQGKQRRVYTLFSKLPEGFQGPLFAIHPVSGSHLIDLWHHQELPTDPVDKEWQVKVNLTPFDAASLGTNDEGAVDCITLFPELLGVSLDGDQLNVEATKGDSITIWHGNPDYAVKPFTIPGRMGSMPLTDSSGSREGKFVVQLFEDGELSDERIITVQPGLPRLTSKVVPTPPAGRLPREMVRIPSGTFRFHGTSGDEFIPYPQGAEGKEIHLPAFLMDKFPVTNQQFFQFLQQSGYQPKDTARFLKNWDRGKVPVGKENDPVAFVSAEDARAYAKWNNKRLPTEQEWQYAAQAGDGRLWPWEGNKSGRDNLKHYGKLEGYCNPGNGICEPVGHYKKGKNPFGLMDLVGSVWQMTNDEYVVGSYRYLIMKGGSYFNPTSSGWYVKGGPHDLTYRQQLLKVTEGFERNATVGFRCIKDLPGQ
ncbi:MAG: formylglycine-generating enzyme family protein [Marinilabiliales bacterium]|nr:formylglycine-generating enzyme family protein [Marinilabiliales bacterium]